jgi:hypothetical protein
MYVHFKQLCRGKKGRDEAAARHDRNSAQMGPFPFLAQSHSSSHSICRHKGIIRACGRNSVYALVDAVAVAEQ